jgi:hypothetical protein
VFRAEPRQRSGSEFAQGAEAFVDQFNAELEAMRRGVA